MKTLEEIINDYENKKYQAEYPNRDNYKFIENEDETIKQNRERKLKLENDYKTDVSEYRKKQSILSEKLKDDIIKTQIGCGLSKEKLERIYNKSYDEKHSYMVDVFYYFEDLVDFIIEIDKL